MRTLEQHNIPSIILLLTQFFRKIRSSWMQKKPPETWKRLHLTFIAGCAAKANQTPGMCRAACVGLRRPSEGLMHMQLSKICSPWGALHYFDISFTVKTEQELAIHIATCHSNLSDELPSALSSPANCVPTRMEPSEGSGGRGRRRLRHSPDPLHWPQDALHHPRTPGARGRMDFASRSASHFSSSGVVRRDSSTHSRHWKGRTDRLAGQATEQPSQHWIAQSHPFSFGWWKFCSSSPLPASLDSRWTVRAFNDVHNCILQTVFERIWED